MDTNIAFALGGLGGFNSHGAGFLTAATELNVKPDLVTATSGQIIVLGEWLRNPHADLEQLLVDPGRPVGLLGMVMTAFSGDPGIFRPAIPEYWQRWGKWLISGTDLTGTIFPAQDFVSLRSDEYFQELANIFNAPSMSIGVVFNAYELESGKGILFGNDAARTMLPEVTLNPITKEALSSSLWLSLYGFEGLPNGRLDGAYQRACIVSELHGFDTVFTARPLAQGWRGKVPSSWFDVQDWQCEMWFTAAYNAEVADMQRINKMYDQGFLTKKSKYKKVNLIDVPTQHPAGYFNYFSERPDIFDAALSVARTKLRPYANISDALAQ